MTTKTATQKMTHHALGWEVTVPAGTYFLGDPCYAIPEQDWMPLLESCGYFADRAVGEVHGHQVLAFGTRWGDGTYYDTDEREYSVDAGLIGLVPQDLYAGTERYDLGTLGQVVTFAQDVTASTDATSGLLVFGPHKIDTDPEQDDYEDQEWS